MKNINVKSIINSGSDNCNHVWVYTSESHALLVDPPKCETYRICSACGRLEKIEGKGHAMDANEFKKVYNMFKEEI